MCHLSIRVRLIQFWLGDFSGRNVRDDVAETQMTKIRPSQAEQFYGHYKNQGHY